jgi:peptidoglycan hydrolase-like protein with peptidoglycan-binding domain
MGGGQDTLGVAERDTLLRLADVDGIEIGHIDPALGNMFAGNTAQGSQTLPIWNSSNITIQGNRFGVGGGENPDPIATENDASHVAVELFDNGGLNPITSNAENIIIRNNELYNGGSGAVLIRVSDTQDIFNINNVVIDNNVITYDVDYIDSLSEQYAEGIRVTGILFDVTIDNNIITNAVVGIFIQNTEDANIDVINNTITSEIDSLGIGIQGASGIVIGGIENGNSIDVTDLGIEILGGDNMRIQGNDITNQNPESANILVNFGGTNILVGGGSEGEENILSGGIAGLAIFYSVLGDDFGYFLDNIAYVDNILENNQTDSIWWILDTDGDQEPDELGPIENGFVLDGMGINRLIYYPIITEVADNGDNTITVSYELEASAGDYRIEFYQDDIVSDSGHGIGNTFGGFEEIEHSGSGVETFTLILPGVLEDYEGFIMSATMTEIIAPGTNDWNFGATSQFGPQFVFVIEEVVEEQPTPTRSSGGSVQQQVTNLQNMGKEEQAQELKDQFEHLFDNKTPTIESLLTQIQQLKTLLIQLTNSNTNISSPQTLSCIPPLRRGDARTDQVQLLQQKLNIIADGIFGPQTEQSVRNFQITKNLTVDGIAGNQTCSAF